MSGDKIQAVHSIDFDERVTIVVVLEEPPLSVVRSESDSIPGKRRAADLALGRIVTQQQGVLGTIRMRESNSEASKTFSDASTEEIFRLYTALNALILDTRRWMIPEIRSIPGVQYVYLDRPVSMLNDELPESLNPGRSSFSKGGQRATGEGIVISIVDTGLDYNHPALGSGFGPAHRVIGGYDFINNDADPMDDNGHGTHVAGIAAGLDGDFSGIAPAATLLAMKVLDESGSGQTSSVIAGVERSLDPDQDPTTDDAADVINLSLGGGGTPDDPLSTAVDNAVLSGVVCVVAAGNDGSGERYQSIGSPGMARRALTVGATDYSKLIASFSSRGPTPDLYAIKPDVLGYGVNVNSAAVGGGYVAFNGTSMATPHVAGEVALLLEQQPEWTPSMIKSALMLSADDTGNNVWTQGSGFINPGKAATLPTLLEPASLSPGLVSTIEDEWTWTDTLQISNLTSEIQTYDFTVGVLPQGVSASVSPAQVSLGAAENADIVFSLRVQNQILPYATTSPPGYESHIRATSPLDTLLVPFAFIKSHSLNFTFSEEPWVIDLHNRRGDSWTYAYPGPALNALLPQDTYDIVIKFGDEEISTILRHDVEVEGDTDIFIDKAEAEYTIAVVGTAYDGSLLPLNFAQRIIEHESGYGTFTSTFFGGDMDQVDSKMSSLGQGYTLSVRTSHFPLPGSSLPTFHDGPRHRFTDLERSVVITNSPEQVTAVDYQYATDPGTTELFVFDSVCEAGSCSTRYDPEGPSANRIEAPFVRRVYLVAAEEETFFFKQDVYRTDGIFSVEDAGTVLYSGPYTRIRPDDMLFYRFLDLDNPVFELSRLPEIRIPVHFPLIRWAGRTYNQANDIIRLGGLEDGEGRHAFGYFLDRYGTMRRSSFSYLLTQGDQSVSEGTIVDLEIGPYFTDIQASPGVYDLELGHTGMNVAGEAATSTTLLSFDTANSVDPNPPFITSYSVLSDGQVVSSLSQQATNTIEFAVSDDQMVNEVSLDFRASNDSTWTNLPTQVQEGNYTAALPDSMLGQFYDLQLTADDGQGNALTYSLTPAFHVSGLAIPLLSSPASGATMVPVQTEMSWYAVPGATSYHVQVATDSSFTTLILDDAGVLNLSRALGPLDRETHYVWRVRANNAGQPGAWSVARGFTSVLGLPAAPVLLLPENDATDQTIRPSLSWEALDSALDYHVQLAEDDTFSQLVFEDSTLAYQATGKLFLSYATTYYWRVRTRNVIGKSEWSATFSFTIAIGTSSDEEDAGLPLSFALNHGYPNPFSRLVQIPFDLPETANVSLKIHDIIGREIATIYSGILPAGRHRYNWDALNRPSGIYIYTLTANHFSATRQLILIR